MIRITTQQEESCALVTIEDQLTAKDVGEIRRVRDSVRGRVVLKLAGLSLCADEGIHLLRDWLQAGARLESATPFLRMVLEKPGET